MKIAILGPSEGARFICRDLLALGASVRLFWPGDLTDSELRRWLQEGHLINAPWGQVTKRFLAAGEVPSQRSRFLDLFRVSYSVNPEAMIARGLSEQPEVYQRLSDEFVASLRSQLEMFEDVDVVVDASAPVTRRYLGPGGPAIGEARLTDDRRCWAGDARDWQSWIKGAQEVALVGDGRQAAETLMRLKEWWQGPLAQRIFLISSAERPFAQFMREDHGELNREVQEFLSFAAAEEREALQRWEKEKDLWLAQDDFIRAKKPLREAPQPRLVIFAAHVLTGADLLVDKSRVFLTLERVPWKTPQVQPENGELELKTIGVDRVIGAVGREKNRGAFFGLDLLWGPDGKAARDEGGLHPEVGFFSLPSSGESARRVVLAELAKLFSPRAAAP